LEQADSKTAYGSGKQAKHKQYEQVLKQALLLWHSFPLGSGSKTSFYQKV